MADYADEQVKKALERMSEEDPEGFSSDVLDLINRQEAEIERLKGELKSYKQIDKYIHDRLFDGKDFSTQEAFEYAYQQEIDRLCNIETAKSDAIKKFLHRLHDLAFEFETDVEVITVDDIDNLVKEMVGEGK